MEIYNTKKGEKRFREMIRVNGKAIKSKSFKKKTDAIAWKRRKLSERDKLASFGSLAQPDLMFKDFIPIWIEKKVKVQNSKRTLENYTSDINNHLLPAFGYTGIGFINHNQLSSFTAKMKGKNLSNRTINKVVTVLKTILNDAVRWEYIDRNPTYSYPELKIQQKPVRFLDEVEIQMLLTTSHATDIFPVLFVAIYTGMRIGEILALRWDRVDFIRKHIHVTRTMTRNGLQEQTKTHRSRIVPMSNGVENLLRDVHKRQRSPEWVFTKEDGTLFDVNHFSQREYKKILKKANLDTSYKFHHLRHTFCSHFVMKGGNLYDLQKIVGHKDIKTTQIYAHLSQKYLDEAIKIMDFGDVFQTNEPNLNQEISTLTKEPAKSSLISVC